MTAPVAQLNLATSFMNELTTKTTAAYEDVRLGDLMLKASVDQGVDEYNKDTVDSWTLFGDPTIQLPEGVFTPQAAQAPRAPASGGGGGGCSAGASNGPQQAPAWWWLELLFFMLPIIANCTRRRRRKFSN